MQTMFEYRLEHIMSYTVKIAEPEVIGPVPEGLRVNGYILGGEVTGPRVSGKLRPVGGDWLTIRKHGVAILDVRATIETHDGALIDSDIVAADNQTITIIIRYLYGHRHPEAGAGLSACPRKADLEAGGATRLMSAIVGIGDA